MAKAFQMILDKKEPDPDCPICHGSGDTPNTAIPDLGIPPLVCQCTIVYKGEREIDPGEIDLTIIVTED